MHKNPHQRVFYQRSYDGSDTISSLEIYSSSSIIHDIFLTSPKYHPSVNIMCEVSILHVYNKNVEIKLGTIIQSLTTVTPNLLGLEKSTIGDPDNSPLTGGYRSSYYFHSKFYSIILFCFVIYNSML